MYLVLSTKQLIDDCASVCAILCRIVLITSSFTILTMNIFEKKVRITLDSADVAHTDSLGIMYLGTAVFDDSGTL